MKEYIFYFLEYIDMFKISPFHLINKKKYISSHLSQTLSFLFYIYFIYSLITMLYVMITLQNYNLKDDLIQFKN